MRRCLPMCRFVTNKRIRRIAAMPRTSALGTARRACIYLRSSGVSLRGRREARAPEGEALVVAQGAAVHRPIAGEAEWAVASFPTTEARGRAGEAEERELVDRRGQAGLRGRPPTRLRKTRRQQTRPGRRTPRERPAPLEPLIRSEQQGQGQQERAALAVRPERRAPGALR